MPKSKILAEGEITVLPYRKSNIVLARNLRKNMTVQERKLWYEFLRDCDFRFQRQKAIGRYIADFYCACAKVIIEIDGGQHYEDEAVAYDSKRTEYFENLGIKVLRYTNREINFNFADVCNNILFNLKIYSTPQSPTVTAPLQGEPKKQM